MAAWHDAVAPRIPTAEDAVTAARGYWNSATATWLLPALLNPGETRAPTDADRLVEAYTRHLADVVNRNAALPPGALADPGTPMDLTGLSWRAQQAQLDYPLFIRKDGTPGFWQRNTQVAAFYQAAWRVQEGRPPGTDPVHGQPYLWDPATRVLSPPATPEFKGVGMKPVRLPPRK